MTRAILFATGYHPELMPLVEHRPSPLFRLADKAVIIHVIEFLVRQGISRFDLILHHFPEQIEELVGDGERWGAEIHCHLLKDPRQLPHKLRVLSHSWGDEQVLLAAADYLPVEEVEKLISTPEGQCALVYEEGQNIWSAWGTVPASALQSLASLEGSNLAHLLPQHQSLEATGLSLGARNFREYHSSQLHILNQSIPGFLRPTSIKEEMPGVWVAANSTVHPSAQLHAPVIIGEHCQIKANASVGPHTVVETHCIIDQDSELINSTVCRNSYVGEGLEIRDSIVDRNSLVNLTHDTQITVSDEFILCALQNPSVARDAAHLFERFIAGLCLLILSPILLPLIYFNPLKSEQVLHLPQTAKGSDLETFSWLSFESRWALLSKLPGLFHILKGEAHFVGLAPRTEAEFAGLSQDWRDLYLRSKIGLLQLSALHPELVQHSDDLYSCEAFYSAKMGPLYDIKIALSFLFKKLTGQLQAKSAKEAIPKQIEESVSV